jgi:hypothetical protein
MAVDCDGYGTTVIDRYISATIPARQMLRAFLCGFFRAVDGD